MNGGEIEINKTLKTRRVARSRSSNYLKKAKECHDAMEHCFNSGDWNACILNAIHCAISCIDALTVYILEQRYAGQRHLEALELLKRTDLDKGELKQRAQQFAYLLSIKNIAEYEDRLMNEKDAKNGRKSSNRIYYWVLEKLPDQD